MIRDFLKGLEPKSRPVFAKELTPSTLRQAGYNSPLVFTSPFWRPSKSVGGESVEVSQVFPGHMHCCEHASHWCVLPDSQQYVRAIQNPYGCLIPQPVLPTIWLFYCLPCHLLPQTAATKIVDWTLIRKKEIIVRQGKGWDSKCGKFSIFHSNKIQKTLAITSLMSSVEEKRMPVSILCSPYFSFFCSYSNRSASPLYNTGLSNYQKTNS